MKAEKMSFEEIGRVQKFGSDEFSPVLTVVCTDIVGSVTIVQKIGAHAYHNLKAERHDKPIIEIITRDQKGIIIKPRGDGFMCIFSSPSVATERALEIQQKFHNDDLFKLRIGISMGEVFIEEVGSHLDIVGMAPNIAARAESMCEPGHLLVTRPVFESASSWIPQSQCCWKNHGFWALKPGEDFYEYIEPFNSNLIAPSKPAKGTQSCVPTFENVFIFLTNALIFLFREAAYYFELLLMLIYFFAKKNNTELPYPRSKIILYTVQEENGIHGEYRYSESKNRDNIAGCIPLNRGRMSSLNLTMIFVATLMILLSIAD